MRWGLKAVTVRFGAVTALDSVDCSVDSGSVLAVIGPDGAGKSTLARVQVGLVAPNAGTVTTPDRRALGYQAETGGSWADLTVTENLDFVAHAHRLGRTAGARLDDLLDITDLSEARNRLAGALSGGMRQKLAVAMAMLPRPDLLVLDEPTTGLDPVSRGDVWRLLARAAEDGAALIVTTAYLEEARRADDVIVLDQGNVLVQGPAGEIEDSFPGILVSTPHRDPDRPSWRRGRTWRTWIRDVGTDVPQEDQAEVAGDGTPTDGPRLRPDLEDVAMAAAIERRDGGQ